MFLATHLGFRSRAVGTGGANGADVVRDVGWLSSGANVDVNSSPVGGQLLLHSYIYDVDVDVDVKVKSSPEWVGGSLDGQS